MKSIELIVRILIRRNDKVLLCKNIEHGYYYLPGGHVEFEDSLEDTIYKEMNEELGLKKEEIINIFYKNYLEQMFIQDGKNHHELNMIFSADISGDINIMSQEDYISFEWMNVKDIKNVKLLPEKIINFI